MKNVVVAIDDLHPEQGWGCEGDIQVEYLTRLNKQYGVKFTLFCPSYYHHEYKLTKDWVSYWKQFDWVELCNHGHYHDVQKYTFDQMVIKMDSLKQEYEVKRLMALDKGASIKQEIEEMEKQAQNYQAEKIGPQGELMRKQAQLEYDILAKVKKAVDKVAIAGGYDYIMDASVAILYYKPKFDLTDDVVHELGSINSSK